MSCNANRGRVGFRGNQRSRGGNATARGGNQNGNQSHPQRNVPQNQQGRGGGQSQQGQRVPHDQKTPAQKNAQNQKVHGGGQKQQDPKFAQYQQHQPSTQNSNSNHRRRQHKKQSEPSNQKIDKEVVNKLAEVLFSALQSGATAPPQWNFIQQELTKKEQKDVDEDEDEDDDDDSSVYSLTSNSKLSQMDQNFGLSQSSFGDFYSLSQTEDFSGKMLSQQSIKQPAQYPVFYPKVGIYWDIENCPLPRGKSAMHFVKRMRDTFCHDHTEDKFLVVCDTHKQVAGVIDELEKSLVRIEHVSGSAKNAADECLRRNMREFAENNVAPAKIVLITGDINFNSELHDMKYKRHFNVVLVHNKQTSEALKLVASQCHELEEFCVNLPDRNAQAPEGPVTVKVSHLPKDVERGKVMGRLSRLVNTFGGKVVKIFDPPKEAIVQFPSRADALRAQSSLTGEDVHGSKIKLYLISNMRNITGEGSKQSGNDNNNKLSPPKIGENKQTAKVNEKSTSEEKFKGDDPVGNPCLVSFCLNEKISMENLRRVLLKYVDVDEVKGLTLNYSEGNKSCYSFKCASLNAARKNVKGLNQIQTPQLYDVQKLQIKLGEERKIPIPIPTPIPVVNSDLQVCLSVKKQYLTSHESKRKKLHDRLLFLNTFDKHSPDFESTFAEELVTAMKRYNLMVDMEREFQQTTSKLIAELQNGKHVHDPSAKLLVECMHLSRASPVYAYRGKIMTSLATNPVTVLSGNAGCGKSTQVVQYIFEAMGNEKWQIACTQPHKSLVTLVGSTVAQQMKMDKGISYRLSKSNNQKLLYVTDHTLLMECFTNKMLNGYTHVLIDEAQERTYSTEILLAYLKIILPIRKGLRLMVITTPERSGSLSQYFNGCPIINVDYPSYPVEKIWQTPTQNYVKEAVGKAIELVLSESTGDVLVFLPNASDVNYAAHLTTKKLENEENIRVHKLLLIRNLAQTYKSLRGQSENRNVIFATGKLEKIVSFPNVRFVVDCGLTTEYRSGINCKFAETKYVTITSAEIRASKAALNSIGKCYRFYSPQKFAPFPSQTENSSVELLVLCVIRLQISPSSFDFIDPLTNLQIQNALTALKKIKAITETSVTEKGSNLIKLPIDIHLSHLMMEGITDKVQYETLSFVAVASTVHMYTVLTAETTNIGMKNLIKLVEDYLQWSGMNVTTAHEFLHANKIAKSTMDIIHEQVLDLHAALSEMGFVFKLKSTTHNWREKLQKIVASCWCDNLCVLQRPCDNVYTWTHRNQSLRLLPSLASNQSCAQFVIFETYWKMRSGDYIANIVAIDEQILDDVKSCDEVGKIKKVLQQEMSLIRPVGHHIVKSVFVGGSGVQKIQWEKKLSDLVNATVNLSVFQNKGELKVYCAIEHKMRVLEELQRAIEKARAKMAVELWEFCICKQTGMRIVWGKFATVFQFLMPYDFMTVIVFAPETQSTNSIIDAFRVHGQIVHHSEKTSKTNKKQVNIMFSNPTSAMHALGHRAKGFTTKPRLVNVTNANEMPPPVVLNVTWTRRKNVGTAVVIFDKNPTVDFAQIRSIRGFENVTTEVDSPNKRVILRNVKNTLSKNELEMGVKKMLNDDVDVVKIDNVQMTQEPGFQTSEEELIKLSNKLKDLFATVFGGKVVVTIKEPNLKDDTWSATVSVNDFQLTRSSLDSIRELTLDECHLHFTTNYFCCIFCGAELLDAVKKDFVAELEDKKGKVRKTGCDLRVSTAIGNNGKVAIKFEGDELDEVIASYQCLAQRLRASFIDVSNYDLTERFSVDETKDELMRKCSSRAKTYVSYDKYSNRLAVVGDSGAAEHVEELLQLEMAISQSLDEATIYCSSPSGLIRELAKLYEPQFTGLLKIPEIVRVKFNVVGKSLRVRGQDSAVKEVEAIVASVSSNLRRSADNKQAASEVCPICLDDVHKADHNYRMESCGHAYCFPCMCAYVANSTPPISCMFENCSEPLVFRDLTNLQQECPLLLRNLADRASANYLEKNKTAFFFCPVPDCDGVLKRSAKEQNCAKCFNKICNGCEVLYHYGQTCKEYQKTYKKPDQIQIDTAQVQRANREPEETSDTLSILEHTATKFEDDPDDSIVIIEPFTSATKPKLAIVFPNQSADPLSNSNLIRGVDSANSSSRDTSSPLTTASPNIDPPVTSPSPPVVTATLANETRPTSIASGNLPNYHSSPASRVPLRTAPTAENVVGYATKPFNYNSNVVPTTTTRNNDSTINQSTTTSSRYNYSSSNTPSSPNFVSYPYPHRSPAYPPPPIPETPSGGYSANSRTTANSTSGGASGGIYHDSSYGTYSRYSRSPSSARVTLPKTKSKKSDESCVMM